MMEHEHIIKQLEAENRHPRTTASQREQNLWSILQLKRLSKERDRSNDPPVFYNAVEEAVKNPGTLRSPSTFMID